MVCYTPEQNLARINEIIGGHLSTFRQRERLSSYDAKALHGLAMTCLGIIRDQREASKLGEDDIDDMSDAEVRELIDSLQQVLELRTGTRADA